MTVVDQRGLSQRHHRLPQCQCWKGPEAIWSNTPHLPEGAAAQRGDLSGPSSRSKEDENLSV